MLDIIRARHDQLIAVREQLMANLNATQGAIKLCEELIVAANALHPTQEGAEAVEQENAPVAA